MPRSCSVIVPWRGGCQHRERAWAWVRRQLEATGCTIVVAEAPPGPWVKAARVMPAIEQSSAEIVVVHDADVWTDGLVAAVQAVADGAGWAIPHRFVHRLTEQATQEFYDGAEAESLEVEPTYDRPEPYRGIRGGGVVVGQREVLLDVPMDPRYVGWGQEDASWGVALNCLAGRPWLGTAPLFHLWHPPQDRATRKWGTVEGRVLYRRYERFQRDPVRMRQLLEEIPCSPT